MLLALALLGFVITTGMWAIGACGDSCRNTLVVLFSFLLVLAWNWTLPGRLPGIIEQDTILTLSVFHGWLLFILAFGVTLCFAWGSMFKTCYLQRHCLRADNSSGKHWFLTALVDLLLTIAGCWLAMTLVPQFFYLFYRVIIPALPLQWVVESFGIGRLWQLVHIDKLTILSDLSAGLLLNTLLTALIWSWVLVSPVITSRYGL